MTDAAECRVEINGWEMTPEVATALEQAQEQLSEELSEIIHGERDESPSGWAYCGCLTCDTRETLYTLVPLIAGALAAGDISPSIPPANRGESHGA